MGPEEARVAQSNGPESRSSRASRTRLSPLPRALPRCYHAPATFPVQRGSGSALERGAILDVTRRKHATLYVFRITPRTGLEGRCSIQLSYGRVWRTSYCKNEGIASTAVGIRRYGQAHTSMGLMRPA